MLEQANRPGKCQILIVEDVAAMRLYLRLALERVGAVVTEAGDLKQARAALRNGMSFSALLLDLALPDGNGLDLAREAPAHSRIIALSADDSPETLLRCREAGCDSVVRKSRGPSELRRLLEDISECVIPSPAAGSKEQHELADRYLEFLAESRVAMQRAWHHSDFKTLRRVAHRLRGTAIHFGYASVGANAQALGVALAAENKKQVNERLGLLAQIICEAVETYHLKTKGRMPTEE